MSIVEVDTPYSLARKASQHLCEALDVERFDAAVVLGSGWGDSLQSIGTVARSVHLETAPGFVECTVPGHIARASSIETDGGHVLAFSGRTHLYEGSSVATVVHSVRTAHYVGCRSILLTNAAGSINPEWAVGTPVMISDHLNLMGTSPMVGAEPPIGVPGRFCDLTNAYSDRIRQIAARAGVGDEGVYAGMLGGNYETPAEIRMLRTLGADLVGMSTVLEAIAARHLGMEVGAISLVTNLAAGVDGAVLDHEDVLAQGEAAKPRIAALLGELVPQL